MKVLSTDGLTKLIQLVKSAFISVDDTVATNEVTLSTVATSGRYNDLTNIPTSLLMNTSTGATSLTILGTATNKTYAINIGYSSQATGSYGVSLGVFSYANGSQALGLGYSARATANYAIQLGKGTNSTASTLYVGFNNSNYLLLDGSTGLIPDARLSSNILRSADLSGYATENWVNNQGYLTGITSSDVTSALGYTPYNATNPNGYITSSALSGYEQTSNKVTSISSSSTDTEYPTAKCVYDIVGDIETALHTINSGS